MFYSCGSTHRRHFRRYTNYGGYMRSGSFISNTGAYQRYVNETVPVLVNRFKGTVENYVNQREELREVENRQFAISMLFHVKLLCNTMKRVKIQFETNKNEHNDKMNYTEL